MLVKRHVITFGLILLFSFFAQFTLLAQHCADCKIPSSQRPGRLTAADNALRSAEQNMQLLRARHLPYGLHRPPANATNEKLLYQNEWLTWYDDDLKGPLWVAYFLTKAEALIEGPRQDCFRRDMRLSDTDASECRDYAEPIFDRGHMIPRNDLNRSRSAHDNSFLFSNMSPQFANFNQRVWRRLEKFAHDSAIKSDGLYIITGAAFDRDNNGKRDSDDNASRVSPHNRVAVPTHYYKILINRRPNGIIDTISFLLPHNNLSNTNNDGYLKSKIVSIETIEGVTGIEFCPLVPNLTKPKSNFSSVRASVSEVTVSDSSEVPLARPVKTGRAASLNRWFTF